MATLALFCLLSGLLSPSHAAPAQIVLDSVRSTSAFDPLHHLSGIAPYWERENVASHPPETCRVSAATYVIRHGAIAMNDEEWEEGMEDFIEKLVKFQRSRPEAHAQPPLEFLPRWRSPLTELDEQMEALTDPGARDAEALGYSFAHLYPHLKPKGKEPFHIWAADTPRDVKTAKAFIRGALPEHDKGSGTGDGHVKLIKVPKKTVDWKASLTPHKACPRFTKENGKKEREAFKRTYLPAIVERFNKLMPGFDFTSADVYSMQQLCGYETAIAGASPLCHAFRADDWLAFEYANDLHYWHMVGYGNEFAPHLGIPFLKTATTRILQDDASKSFSKPEKKPKSPPWDTSTGQKLYVWFAHRDEIPLVAVALGLFNNSDIVPTPNINDTMPTTHIPTFRLWRTSDILPFISHIALERLECGKKKDVFVRAVVNSMPIPLTTCRSGPGDSCPLEDFRRFFDERVEQYGDFEGACGLEKKLPTGEKVDEETL